MRLCRRDRFAAVLFGLLLAGCARQPPPPETGPPEVVVCQPYREKVQDWDVYTGFVEAKENVEVRAKVQAYIKEVKFKEGDEVEAGKLLFMLDDAPFQADLKTALGELDTYKAKLQLAEEQMAIYKKLINTGGAAKQDLDKAISAKGEALGALATAEGKIQSARVNIDYCQIKASIAGKTGQALLTKGNLVNSAGTQSLLTTIRTVDPMYVYFWVNERAVLEYLERSRNSAASGGKGESVAPPKGATADKGAKNGAKEKAPPIPVEMALATDMGFPHKGVIDFWDNTVDPGTGSLKVRAKFDNPVGLDGNRMLTPGLFARVRVQVADPYPAVLIADRAILTDQSLKYVLVVNKQKSNQVERVDVELGRLQDDGLRIIKSGLKGDEWIVVDGLNRVRPGVAATPKEGTMPRLTAKNAAG